MEIIKIEQISRCIFRGAVFALILILTFTSCRKGQPETADITSQEQATIQVSVGGILGNSTYAAKTARVSLSSVEKMTSISSSPKASTYEVHGTVGFDFYAQEEGVGINSKLASRSSSEGNQLGELSASSTIPSIVEPMQPGRNYRVVFYNMSSGSPVFAAAKDMVSGVSDSVSLQKGVNYRWMAYSYNNDDPIPAWGNQQIPTFTDREFLSDEGGTFTIPSNQSQTLRLNVLFKQRLARVGFRIDANGVTAQKITEISGNYNGPEALKLYKGSYDLLNSSLLVGQEVWVPIGTPLDFNTEGGDEAVKSAYFYTAIGDGVWANALQLDLTSLKVKLLPSTDYPTGQDLSSIVNSTAFNFYGFSQHRAGKSSTGVIELGAAGAKLGSLIWSLGNLYYENGLYRFRTDGLFNYFNTTTGAENNSTFVKSYGSTDYWFWMSPLPDQSRPDFNLNRVDPCSLVLPKGAWRMPTGSEYQQLNSFDRRSSGSSTREVVQFCDGCGSSTSASWTDGSKSIFTFKADGRWQPEVAYGTIAGYGGPWSEELAYDTYALFWTADHFPYVNGTVTNENKQSIKITNYARHSGGTISLQQALTGDPLGVRRYQIRCVRPI